VSFILDALRKSEHERQRQTGPGLAEVPIATPKARSNVWAPVAIALLLVNLAVVGVLLIRKSSRDTVVPPAVAASEGAAGQTAASAAAAQPSPTTTSPVATPAPLPAAPQPAQPAPAPAYGGRNPLEAEAAGVPPTLDPQVAARAAAAPPGPPAVTRTPAARGSVVYESLPDSATVGSQQYTPQTGSSRPDNSGGSGLPSADELAGSGIPHLHLDLHVYATVPAQRLVFINSHRYREGDTLQEGPEVRQITPGGVVLEYHGRSYLLTHD
jgi:general secretion pathway protein B